MAPGRGCSWWVGGVMSGDDVAGRVVERKMGWSVWDGKGRGERGLLGKCDETGTWMGRSMP